MGALYRKDYKRRLEDNMIKEIMREHNINPALVPTGKKGRVVQYCHGMFTCPNCTARSWLSSWSWILFDLRNQRIKYRFHQKCASCLTPTEPELEEDKMRKLIEKVCKRYLRRVNQPQPLPDPEPSREIEKEPIHPQDDPTELERMRSLFQGALKSTKKHQPRLCEKCGYGRQKEPCFAAVLRSYNDYFINVEKIRFMDFNEE